jgi:signal transduction histidine kinase
MLNTDQPLAEGSSVSTRYTLLLVDDTPTNLSVLSEYLKQYGFKVIVARDGDSGIKRAQYAQPDIILLDVMMPGIDGFETCRRLKADALTRDIPVIFMTALAGTDDKVKGFSAGAVDYVTKPLQQEEVLARLTTHLKIQALTHSLQRRNQQLEASHLVAQRITSILNLEQLLLTVVGLIQTQFGYYFVGVWLASPDKKMILQAGSGQDIHQQLATGFVLPTEVAHVITEACQSGQAAIIADIQTDPRHLTFQELPATCAELVLPLNFGSETLGVLDIHSEHFGAFDADSQITLQIMANQIAIAIHNAHQYQLAENRARELAELNANRDKFFAVIAHDLRAPFSPLLTLSLLQSRLPDDTSISKVREVARRIYNSARNAHNLLENLLQWLRLQLGHVDHYPEYLDVQAVMTRNLRLLSEVAHSKDIQLENAVPPGTRVYADDNMLQAIIRNLISNALKFTPSGGTVTIGVSPGADPEHFLELWVRDTGVGIAPEDLPKLFRLEKPHSTTGTAQERGTGLGLILCQEMVTKNKGRLWVESELGQGTTIKFTLPRQTPVTAPAN